MMITDTPEPTATFTPSPTPEPTPNYYVELTTPAGEPARIARELSVADYVIVLILLAILVSMWAQFILRRLKGDK
jgi:hypothetical protein